MSRSPAETAPRGRRAGRGAGERAVGLDTLRDPERVAREAGLRYVDPDEPGIRRRRCGRGFTYLRPDGTRLPHGEERRRCEALAVPPAYTDVWICLDPDGHLQATGRDGEGRKQYVYHPRWTEAAGRAKWSHVLEFGRALPRLRARVDEALERGDGLERDRVLAAVARLLDRTLVRVGNAAYAERNGSYGLTTLRRRHVLDEGEDLVAFEFVGKGGKGWHVEVDDPDLLAVIRACEEESGWELFKYHDADGARRDVGSDDVNAWLREAAGEDVSAKDFRTWAGTVIAAEALREADPPDDERAGRSEVARAVETVAERLGNTPAVARSSYVHPDVIEAYLEGGLRAGLRRRGRPPAGLRAEEAAVLRFLEARAKSRRASAA